MSPTTTQKTVLTGQFGPVKIVTTLYGPVTTARYEHEKRQAAYRANMLDWTRPHHKIRIEPEDRDSYYEI